VAEPITRAQIAHLAGEADAPRLRRALAVALSGHQPRPEIVGGERVMLCGCATRSARRGFPCKEVRAVYRVLAGSGPGPVPAATAPIPGEWLSAAVDALRQLANGASLPEAARAVLEAVVPLVRAEQEPGAVIEWALAYTHRPNVSGLPARRVVQPYPDEAQAREAVAEVLQLAPGDEPALMCREVCPWTLVPGEGGEG
jgi:hypothetical protein